ncbi:MAG: hypothetical protein KIT35_29540 [Piscinibacter sp.]|uniref:hypothetical protein n=1 Tax=Piscinibacter sp. TaxID=1903157 RepID=UPI002582AC69|nr:hypothetical protein [Piscinibacter sp.]MCW5667998.1 hypothetical protein [Piscinibacter sp.]
MNTKISLLAACAALACLAAHADPVLDRNARVSGNGSGDGIAQRGGTFKTAGGAQGGRMQRLVRTEDGAVDAASRAGVSGDNGSAASSRTFTRSADGSTASATRNTTATNANTGVSYDGSTTWTKGSGFSRSGSCTDSGGNTVTCGTQR